ncbi:MAG TPA: hypothetical protein VJ717_08725 [Gemmatimonadaceae bacterium]|nr:hypothetical protein [Gemmatimonadaceae bacterium]
MRLLFLTICIGLTSAPLLAQHDKHAAHQKDSAFRALQERGKRVMGVDQYTSAHIFESLSDGGRIALTRDVDDTLGVRVIREHLRDVARRFGVGDFSLSEAVHANQDIPGVTVLRATRAIRYEYRDLPRGGEVRLTSRDRGAIRAIHEFLQFQRSDHRSR